MNKIYYQTIKENFEYEISKIKGSRFIGNIFYVENKKKVESCLSKVKEKYKAATHNCWAYRFGAVSNPDLFGNVGIRSLNFKCSDDGEPRNTAGKPILSVLEGVDLHNILVVITRYFGGTKLGIGGLIQAYVAASKSVLSQTMIIEKEISIEQSFTYQYVNMSAIMRLINKYQAKVVQQDFDNRKIKIIISMNIGFVESWQQDIQNFISHK